MQAYHNLFETGAIQITYLLTYYLLEYNIRRSYGFAAAIISISRHQRPKMLEADKLNLLWYVGIKYAFSRNQL